MDFGLLLKMWKIGVLLFLESKKPENRSDSSKKGLVSRYANVIKINMCYDWYTTHCNIQQLFYPTDLDKNKILMKSNWLLNLFSFFISLFHTESQWMITITQKYSIHHNINNIKIAIFCLIYVFTKINPLNWVEVFFLTHPVLNHVKYYEDIHLYLHLCNLSIHKFHQCLHFT